VIITDQEVQTIIIMETGLTEMYMDPEIMDLIQDRGTMAAMEEVIQADTVAVVVPVAVDTAAAVMVAADTAVVSMVADTVVAVVTDTNDTKRKTALHGGFSFLYLRKNIRFMPQNSSPSPMLYPTRQHHCHLL
jgi:hypothetical protein